MSDNINRVYSFVKGNKGKAGFLITDNNFNVLHSDVVESITHCGTQYSPLHSDYKAVIESLNYLIVNRGKNSIPLAPVVFIFTNTENNYQIAIDKAKPRKPEVEEFKRQINNLVNNLKRTTHDNNVKFVYVPKNFKDLMPSLESLIKENNSLNQPSKFNQIP